MSVIIRLMGCVEMHDYITLTEYGFLLLVEEICLLATYATAMRTRAHDSRH